MVSKRAELRMVIDSFKFHYERVNKMENSVLKMTDAREALVHKFISNFKELTKSPVVQEVALKKFIEYQFNTYLDNKSSHGRRSIRLEWIIGSTALERWKNVDKAKASFAVRKKLKVKVNLTEDNRPAKAIYNKLYVETNDNEENNKKRFLNSDIGFESCMLTTTLYNHKSTFCLQCKYKENCKEALKRNYPAINEIRKY